MLGALLGAASSIFGGERANVASAREAQKERDFSGAQAGRQMDFQERMRNTEWQAAVKDMEAAGLNPALAYSQGGASSPGGAAGRGGIASQSDVVSPGVSSALQIKRLNADVKAIEATVKKTEAETQQIRGRPTRILEPAVERGVRIMEGLRSPEATFSARNKRIIQYEIGSSARSIRDAISRTISSIRRSMMRGPPVIGPRDQILRR